MDIEQKKPAVDLTELAIGVVVLGIVVAIGANVLINFRDSRLTSTQVLTTSNETLTAVNFTTGTDLTNQWVQGITRVTNATDGTTFAASTYTLSVDSANGLGTIRPTGTEINNTNDFVNVTYTYYNTSDVQYNLPNQAAAGLAEYGNWFTILVIVGIAAVVLSLIFLAFGNKGNVGGGEGGVSF